MIMISSAFASSGCGCCGSRADVQEPNQQSSNHSRQQTPRTFHNIVVVPRPYTPPHHPPTNISSPGSPSAPPYPPYPPVSSYTSGEPPPYEMALAYPRAPENMYEPRDHEPAT